MGLFVFPVAIPRVGGGESMDTKNGLRFDRRAMLKYGGAALIGAAAEFPSANASAGQQASCDFKADPTLLAESPCTGQSVETECRGGLSVLGRQLHAFALAVGHQGGGRQAAARARPLPGAPTERHAQVDELEGATD